MNEAVTNILTDPASRSGDAIEAFVLRFVSQLAIPWAAKPE